MYWQLRHLQENADFVDLAGLKTIDLPNKGLLSGVDLYVWGTTGAGNGKPDVWLHDRLKKIEVIVNGSQVVKSLTGNQLLAHNLYQKIPGVEGWRKNMAAQSCMEHFYINFGRYFHDLDYMLDLSKVNDPEIRIETDFAMTAANGWTNGVAMTDAPYYTVTPHMLREPTVTPKGYIKTSEVYRFTGGANKQENMILPRGPVYSNLYLQGLYAAKGISWALDHVELNINNDKLIPMRLNVSSLTTEVDRKYGVMQLKEIMCITDQQVYPFPFQGGHFTYYHHPNQPHSLSTTDIWGAVNAFFMWDFGVPARLDTYANVWVQYFGNTPFGVFAIPYFDPIDERFWIDSKELGDFWLRVELGALDSSSVTYKLLADEVVAQ